MNKKGIILLSGGLDSLVSLGLGIEEFNIKLALTFDYGQKAAEKEIAASKSICEHYKIRHEIIKLDWLKNITNTALVGKQNFPMPQKEDLESAEFTQNSARAVWVPNRNGLFLNVAACYADSFGYDFVLFGANKEEGSTFPDNTQDFVEKITEGFKFSTLAQPKVVAPLINLSKDDIVKIAVEKGLPLELTRSCYADTDKNCGKCESCIRLKAALEANNCQNLINELF